MPVVSGDGKEEETGWRTMFKAGPEPVRARLLMVDYNNKVRHGRVMFVTVCFFCEAYAEMALVSPEAPVAIHRYSSILIPSTHRKVITWNFRKRFWPCLHARWRRRWPLRALDLSHTFLLSLPCFEVVLNSSRAKHRTRPPPKFFLLEKCVSIGVRASSFAPLSTELSGFFTMLAVLLQSPPPRQCPQHQIVPSPWVTRTLLSPANVTHVVCHGMSPLCSVLSCLSQAIRLTLRPHLLEMRAPSGLPPTGALLDGEVVRIDPALGLLLKVSLSCQSYIKVDRHEVYG